MASPSPKLDLPKLASLTFEAPDPVRFPALRLVREALTAGGSAPTVLNAANEVAVAGFLDHRIGFLDIAGIVEETLDALAVGPISCLQDVYAFDRMARETAGALLAGPARARLLP
jgi:1-deoxy-D-xylulose-5-phosphate reductoisomerase